MFGLFDWLKIGAGVALGATLSVVPVYFYGKSAGRQEAAVGALETSVKVLRERDEIDAKVSFADAAALCGDLGLSDDDEAECVRRVRRADTKPGDVSAHP